MEKHSAQVIVKVISILGYIGAVLGFIAGIVMLFGGTFIAGMMPLGANSAAGALVGALAVVMAIIIIAVSIFAFIVAMNLWKYVNWARIAMIVISALIVLESLITLPAGILGLIINGAILYFVAFNKDVVALFK